MNSAGEQDWEEIAQEKGGRFLAETNPVLEPLPLIHL